MARHLDPRRVTAGFAATTVLALSLTTAGPARAAAPGAADAARAAAPGTAAPGDSAPGVTVPTVTVRPDPSYRGKAFEGWGTSLVWFANATGDYPAEVRDKLADLVFGADGLNLNIARYNIGGGNAPDVPDYLRPGGAVEGWWRAPAGTTRTDKDWWDPQNPAHWNLAADRTQRWWIDRIKRDITHWETFSNSPPWFQTVSGYVSGNFDAGQDQIRTDTVDDFATYLARVTAELERAHGITVDTIDPLNEPNTTYWGTRLGPGGNPAGGRQEGAHAGPALQQQVIRALAAKLAALGRDTRISAMDETNPGTFATDWNAYPSDVRDLVAQLNVHTYGTGQRTTVRDIAKGERKPLWMSEVEGSWGAGQSFTSMTPGLGMAQRIVDDLRELEPSAWVFWQPVEDYDNMKPGGESAAGANWGSIQLPFDCTATDTLQTCPIHTNTKFHTVRNFTHHIRPGDRLVKVGDPASVAAVSGGRRATVVHVNDTAQARTVRLDLSAFGSVAHDATVTPVVTSADGALRRGVPIRVRNRTATLPVPAESVTTLLVKGVSGVAPDAALAQNHHVYRLKGVQSARSLTPAGTGAVIRTDDTGSAAQLWRLTELSGGVSNRARYALRTSAGDRQLAVVDGTVSLVPAEAAPGPAAQWILSTTGDGTYTLVNAGTKRLLEVGGQATRDGAPVSTWLANSGVNQRWQIIDETVLGTEPASAFTVPGVAPVLPATVVPIRRDGARGALPVTWRLPPASAWKRAGSVQVRGLATDALGRTHPARATVQVDTLVSTASGRAKTFIGGEATATFTEPGYSPAGLRDGVLTDKAWSNWQSGPKNATDTLTVALGERRAVTRVITHFFRDGSDSYARSLQVQVRDPQDGWADAGGPVTVPTGTATGPAVEVAAPATTDAVRVVLTAHPDRHMTVSEIEVLAAAPGTSADPAAAAIALAGTALAGFDPDRTAYSVRARGRLPKVTAVAADPYATIEVRQPAARNRTATVTVTSEDGSQRRTYTISLRK